VSDPHPTEKGTSDSLLARSEQQSSEKVIIVLSDVKGIFMKTLHYSTRERWSHSYIALPDRVQGIFLVIVEYELFVAL
jgi:hypothetical protein